MSSSEADPLITTQQIAALFGVSDVAARKWCRDGGPLGEPDDVKGRFRRWRTSRVTAWGRETGRLDAEGRPTGTLAGGGGRVIPDLQQVDADGVRLLYVPQVAEMFGVKVRTVEHWGNQRDKPRRPGWDIRLSQAEVFPLPARYETYRPQWREDELLRWGRTTGRLDDQGRCVPRGAS